MQEEHSERVKNVLIVAGEASGDLHGSNLIKAAAEHHPQLQFFGVGGDKMAAAGCRILFPANELSVMGLTEVIGRLPKIFQRFQQLKKVIRSDKAPDLLILIDFPDFNLRLAKIAKAAGVKVLYYISPKVWAWRSGRTKTIAERVDRLALIFPFEPQIFRPFGVQADYLGNPFLDEFFDNRPRGILRRQLGINDKDQVVGIFPGSRNSELRYILDTLIDTAELVHRQKPATKFLVPVAPSLSRDMLEQRFAAAGLPVFIVEDNIYEIAAACDVVLTVSGTVTLQIALVETPMIILYKVAPFSYAIGKRLISVDHVGLPNIVAGKTVVREFIQDDATAENLFAEIELILGDGNYRSAMIHGLGEVKELMGRHGCSVKVADLANELVKQEKISCEEEKNKC